MNDRLLEVGVSLKSGPSYTTDILHGIVEYARQKGQWLLEVDSDFHFGQRPTKIGPDWQGDGFILLGGENAILGKNYFTNRRIPVINATGWQNEYPEAPFVFWDDAEIAKSAAEHLLSLGLQNFAYIGPGIYDPSRQRAAAFQRLVESEGGTCTRLEWSPREIKGVAICDLEDWQKADKLFKQWLIELETPIGILANNDITASLLINAGRALGLRCPQELVVVGFWNDKVICESCRPPLTSIQIDADRVGYTAAALLDNMMRQPGYSPPRTTLIGTKGLIKRESTEYIGLDDELVIRALRFIRKTAPTHALTVQEVLETLPMSRSSFAERFTRAVGHSPKAEIARVRMEHVKKLLETTDWSITRIAEETGFDAPYELSRQFRHATGTAPSQFRLQSKGKTGD